MVKGLPRSLSRGGAQRKAVDKVRLSLNVELTFTGVTDTAVFATASLAGLPEGNILVLGSVANLTFTGPTSDNLANDFQGDVSIGSTPADDNTLTGADADVVASTAIPAASSEVSSLRIASAAQSIIDNTAGTGELNLNVLLDSNEVTNAEDVVITVTGTFDFVFSVLGDD